MQSWFGVPDASMDLTSQVAATKWCPRFRLARFGNKLQLYPNLQTVSQRRAEGGIGGLLRSVTHGTSSRAR